MAARWALGLTGDVGSGKSTVRRWLEDRGAAALDADAVVHDLLASDSHTIEEVAARFASAARRPAEGIDRRALAAIVFADASARRDLEAILHPRVVAVVGDWLGRVGGGVAVVEAVKLFEAGLQDRLDWVWLVTCDRAVRLRRLVARGWSPEEARRRMAAGTPLGPRLALAGTVIDNSGTFAATSAQLERAYRDIAARAASGGRP